MKVKFFRCTRCGQIIAKVKETASPVVCCGLPMEEIIPGSVDASHEKHVPVYKVRCGKVYVSVGEVEHPMVDNHYIEWVCLQTKNGNQRKLLKPGDKPEVVFAIEKGDEVESVLAYCNLHGLWKA